MRTYVAIHNRIRGGPSFICELLDEDPLKIQKKWGDREFGEQLRVTMSIRRRSYIRITYRMDAEKEGTAAFDERDMTHVRRSWCSDERVEGVERFANLRWTLRDVKLQKGEICQG